MEVKEISKIVFDTLVVVVILVVLGLYAFNYRVNDLKTVKNAEITIARLKKIRVALEEYYQKTGTYPNLSLKGASDNLRMLDFETVDGKLISFAKIYGKNVLESPIVGTKEGQGNDVYDTSDFKEVKGTGGWKYNYSENTGEIHVNLKDDYYVQIIKWDEE